MAEERRLVTVLFGDVVGSTSLGEGLDPEDMRRLLGRFYEIAREVVSEHEGTLEKFIGDAAMAIFGLPIAHDDDARRALDAALALREQVRDDPALGDRLPIRIGLNTGEVVASRDPARSDFIVTGDPVNVAARLQQAAEPWQILASDRTASADHGAHEFGAAIDLELKGKGATVRARPLLGRSTAERRHTALVGREADLAHLDLIARRAFNERRPYLVSLIAPAGTGKSRLVEEFLARLEGIADDVQVAIAQCLPYGQRLTYWPMRALLDSLVGLPEETSPESTRFAIREWLTQAGAERPAESAALLAATIGVSDADARDRAPLFAAWREALELAAARRPLLLLIEDLHWSSESLLDLIEYLLQPRSDSPMLMLALMRPELLERRPAWGGGRRNHVSLALEPLDEGSIRQLVEGLLEEPAPELVPLVVSRSEGNPFFAGEIVRSLLERGVDLRDSTALADAAERLPDTVQATVLARLDSLDPVPRRLLQLGSVFGRSFSAEGVRAIEASSADLADAVEQLIERELLRPTGRGELTYRHIIIRDVAYGTLTRSDRAALHAAAGRWLERRAIDREDELAELVAFHYREAAVLASSYDGVDPGLRSSAVHWLRRAAEVAAGGRGMAEAAGHLRAAIDLALPAEQPPIHQRLGEVLASGDASVEAYARAWQLGRDRGLPPDFLLENLSRHLMVLCRWFASVGQQAGEEEIARLIAVGESWLPEAGPRARATFLIALSFKPFWLRQSSVRPVTEADVEEARAHVREGLALAEEIDDPQLISAALDAEVGTYQSADWRLAVKLSRRRMQLGDRLPLEERLDALQVIAWASALLGDLPEAIGASDAAISLLLPGQSEPFATAAASWSAYAHALRGEWDPTRTSVEDLMQRWIHTGRPAASYALQGVLSGIDWARNRGDEQSLERWRSVAESIVGQFSPEHPVAAISAIVTLDLDGCADIVVRHERYPDRAHYVEHALAVCADRRHPVPQPALDEILERARRVGLRVLEAQALRQRGLIDAREVDLAASLSAFEEMGAARYAARLRVELGMLIGDSASVLTGRRQLAALGEGDLLGPGG
ncbi:MAG: adenylate/guanylate cyclase domain-containing protein [Chloroflexota bacterium]